MCPECWDRREQVAAPARTRARLQQPNLVLGLGVAALIPCFWPMQLGSIVVGVYALSKLPDDAPEKAKRNIVIGIVLGCVGVMESVLFLAVIVGRG